MKVMLCTTPIRPVPTDFPPLGSLSIIAYLRRHGVDVDFYNIDANRPTFDEAVDRIAAQRPDVLGISAVVSTAYAYVRDLTLAVKRRLPDTVIVVGGSLAGSAEILLRRTGTDLCATGEGEKTFLAVCRRAQESRNPADFKDIPGLALSDADGAVINTGYETQLSADEIYDIDWEDLARSTDIAKFFHPAFDADGEPVGWFAWEPRALEPGRRDKKIGLLPGAKGCVARCTFCHRWEKGIRYIPPDLIMRRIEYLIDRHNVGFLSIGDENFGTDRRWLREFCEKIARYDILWHVAGMRVNCVTPEIIAMMRNAGCCSILYGTESGSQRILDVMEKKVKIADNYNALRWTVDAGIRTVVQLVIGMPGENQDTIEETAAFAREALTRSPIQSPFDLSINFAQALPGTPLYEYARRRGLIGADPDGEEAYLLQVSDRNAADGETTLNFTDHPRERLAQWRGYISNEVNIAFIRKFGIDLYHQRLIEATGHFARERVPNGYFAYPRKTVDRAMAWPGAGVPPARAQAFKNTVPPIETLVAEGRFDLYQLCYPIEYEKGLIALGRLPLRERLRLIDGTPEQAPLYQSLRKTVNAAGPLPGDAPAMAPLRAGR